MDNSQIGKRSAWKLFNDIFCISVLLCFHVDSGNFFGMSCDIAQPDVNTDDSCLTDSRMDYSFQDGMSNSNANVSGKYNS